MAATKKIKTATLFKLQHILIAEQEIDDRPIAQHQKSLNAHRKNESLKIRVKRFFRQREHALVQILKRLQSVEASINIELLELRIRENRL